MSDKLSIEDNIKNTYLNPMSFLYEEPTNLLKQEVREPAIYTAIITAIATGVVKNVGDFKQGRRRYQCLHKLY